MTGLEALKTDPQRLECKNGGRHVYPQFENQGDWVSFVETGK
jgi:hypothetical protein